MKAKTRRKLRYGEYTIFNERRGKRIVKVFRSKRDRSILTVKYPRIICVTCGGGFTGLKDVCPKCRAKNYYYRRGRYAR